MATTFTEIQEMLDSKGIKYSVHEDDGYIATGPATEVYMDDEGDHHLLVAIPLESAEVCRVPVELCRSDGS